MKNYFGEMIDLTGDSYLNPRGAAYADGSGTHQRAEGTITSIAIHHDAVIRPHDYDSAARYRSEAKGHYSSLGPGLQYHYKIDNVGQIFKIRPHTTWLYAVGSGENVTCLNICLDGYFHPPHNQMPTREQYEALGQLLTFLCEQQPQFPATWPHVRPHASYTSTACAGSVLNPWVYAINSKADALNIPANAVYDWPEYQPSTPPPAPQAPAPTPPTVEVAYRVYKGGKQIGAYKEDKNAWNKYKVESADRIDDSTGKDVTSQLKAKYEPVIPPAPLPPAEQGHDVAKDTNEKVSLILGIVQKIWEAIQKIFNIGEK